MERTAWLRGSATQVLQKAKHIPRQQIVDHPSWGGRQLGDYIVQTHRELKGREDFVFQVLSFHGGRLSEHGKESC
jgi:hypothetical protein